MSGLPMQPGGLQMPGAARPKHHPFANLFPMLGEDHRAEFRKSLAQQQNHPIVLHRGMILDGRNRERELFELGKPIAFVVFTGTDEQAFDFVMDENLRRRHLTESQRAMIAARAVTIRLGFNQHSYKQPASIEAPTFLPEVETPAPEVSAAPVSQSHAADILSVGRSSVQRAATVIEKGAPELRDAVDSGKIAVSTAADIAELPKEEQAQIAAMSEKDILAKAKEIRKGQGDKRRAERSEDIRKKAEASTALPTGRKFPLIYLDPPTKYSAGDSDRSTENHYPTMTEEEIAALPVSELALDQAVLLIWTTVPWLAKTLRMIEGWGFEYQSCACWDKETIGLGFWWRNQHEILIGASRGKPAMPENGSIMGPSLYREKKGRHSAKPEYFRAMIDSVPEWKEWPKVELFSRITGTMPTNWFAWGNEAFVPAQQSLDVGIADAITEENCPGHVASDTDPKVCRHCGVHIDSLRPPEDHEAGEQAA